MSDHPNTEATISEIMGAITLRVLWAALKTAFFFVFVFLIFGGTGLFLESYFGWQDNWQFKWQWAVPGAIIGLWAVLHQATGHRSFHREQWYFPKTNPFTSLLMSAYLVLSVWALIVVGKGLLGGLLFATLYGIPMFINYILNCGYYLVMMRRYPNYEYENFAIPMPSVLFELSMKEGGISGAQNGEEDADYY